MSKGPNKVRVSLLPPEDGNRSSFRNVVFSSYLKFRTMDKVHKPSDSEKFILRQGSSQRRMLEIVLFDVTLCNLANTRMYEQSVTSQRTAILINSSLPHNS
jgi:hypothetical protein